MPTNATYANDQNIYQMPRNSPIEMFIPMLAPGLNGGKGLIRMHFHAYGKVKEAWIWAIKEQTRVKASVPCEIHVERRYATHAMDLDNLYSTLKVPLDALRAAGVLIDDDPNCVENVSIKQVKVKTRKEEGTFISIVGSNAKA